jgi:hypothetical protein
VIWEGGAKKAIADLRLDIWPAAFLARFAGAEGRNLIPRNSSLIAQTEKFARIG